ncbi:nitroreductase family deazaflavin-dependent oxidoreductase [Luedemannella flava]
MQRRMYHRHRPNLLARVLNRIWAVHFASGVLAPRHGVTLEVRGRHTGRLVSFPLVLVPLDGERYLVSMLGEGTNWVANVRADHGHAVLRRGDAERVRLVEVDVAARPPVLRRFLELAPGARPHAPVDRRAPEAEFARVADRFPVFRVTPDPG